MFLNMAFSGTGAGGPPPPPPDRGPPKGETPQEAVRIPITTDGIMVNGQLTASQPFAVYAFSAVQGETYMIETELGSLEDSILNLYATDGNTKIAENDDDERTNNRLASYMEWTCPLTGTYYAEVGCFDCSREVWAASIANPLTFQISVGQSTAPDPCAACTARCRC